MKYLKNEVLLKINSKLFEKFGKKNYFSKIYFSLGKPNSQKVYSLLSLVSAITITCHCLTAWAFFLSTYQIAILLLFTMFDYATFKFN